MKTPEMFFLLAPNLYLSKTCKIQLIEKFKKTDANENATDAGGNDQPTFVLTFLKNIKEARLKFSQGALTVL